MTYMLPLLAQLAATAQPPAWLLAAAMTMAPPGQTKFSVMPAPDGQGRPSAFYGRAVVQEDAEHGRARYERALADLDAVALDQRAEAEFRIANWEHYRPTKFETDVQLMEAAALAVAVYESGLREDVQVGRGWAKKASDDGGMGRGPGWEVCFMQIHPNTIVRFTNGTDEATLEAAERGDHKAREALAKNLLGLEPEHVRECWRVGLRMLVHAQRYCAWASPGTPWDYAMFSLYGTGSSCASANGGKTSLRTSLFRKIAAGRPKVARRLATQAAGGSVSGAAEGGSVGVSSSRSGS